MSKQRAPKRTKDCHNRFRLGIGKWTESKSASDSKTAEAAKGPSDEVHCRSLPPGSSKKKQKLSLTSARVKSLYSTQLLNPEF